MKTVLITAYAVNPFKGSEDGTGWNIVKEIAQEFNVILITRKNNVPHLDRYFSGNDEVLKQRIQYHGFDLSDWILKIKKRSGTKGHVVYFYLWQKAIIGFLKKRSFEFAVSMSLNFHSDSHPHFLWKLNKPCLWGPIGHHPLIPRPFVLKGSGIKAYMIDRMFYQVKWLMRNANPAFKKAVRKSERIFVINSSIRAVINAPEWKTIKLPAVAAKKVADKKENSRESFNVLCAGRFHFMKGFDVALKSFLIFIEHLSPEDRRNSCITLVGSGPEKERLQNIARESRYANRVKWIEWVDHSDMDALYANSDVFLFPSHEGAGMVVPEAMSHGVPTLTFNNVGPGELVGIKELTVEYQDYESSTLDFATKLLELFLDRSELIRLKKRVKEKHAKSLTWAAKGAVIRNELNQII
ncbi:MAG: glycosyltransferase family 4 protein [Crocinitomicaceae bacterium]|nr:glycosyltransferase family 4 protein [Crocinitomicaceae bacterium]